MNNPKANEDYVNACMKRSIRPRFLITNHFQRRIKCIDPAKR